MSHTRLDLLDADVTLYPTVDLGMELVELFENLRSSIEWEQRHVRIYDKDYPQPRLTAWYGDYGYLYSGLKWEPKAWTPLLNQLRDKMFALTGEQFNGVLLNLYQDGQSSIGMHSDDEPEFGPQPIIASLSLGSERTLTFKRKDKTGESVKIPLTDGSVLVMAGDTQRNWKHGITKTTKPVGERINLTFRNILHPR